MSIAIEIFLWQTAIQWNTISMHANSHIMKYSLLYFFNVIYVSNSYILRSIVTGDLQKHCDQYLRDRPDRSSRLNFKAKDYGNSEQTRAAFREKDHWSLTHHGRQFTISIPRPLRGLTAVLLLLESYNRYAPSSVLSSSLFRTPWSGLSF